MPVVSGGGGGASLAPPVTLTGTNPATTPLTIVGAAGQSTRVVDVKTNDGSHALTVVGDGANGISYVSLLTGGFGQLILPTSGDTSLVSNRNTVIGGFGDGFVLSAMNAAPADATLAAGDCALWFDSTNGAAKLMAKAKQANGTVVTASIALA